MASMATWCVEPGSACATTTKAASVSDGIRSKICRSDAESADGAAIATQAVTRGASPSGLLLTSGLLVFLAIIRPRVDWAKYTSTDPAERPQLNPDVPRPAANETTPGRLRAAWLYNDGIRRRVAHTTQRQRFVRPRARPGSCASPMRGAPP